LTVGIFNERLNIIAFKETPIIAFKTSYETLSKEKILRFLVALIAFL
jgi:hypothetical protein